MGCGSGTLLCCPKPSRAAIAIRGVGQSMTGARWPGAWPSSRRTSPGQLPTGLVHSGVSHAGALTGGLVHLSMPGPEELGRGHRRRRRTDLITAVDEARYGESPSGERTASPAAGRTCGSRRSLGSVGRPLWGSRAWTPSTGESVRNGSSPCPGRCRHRP